MKTAGKITANLALLIGLYVLSYWLLIKKGWADKLLGYLPDTSVSHKAWQSSLAAFKPMVELETIWSVDIPTQKHLIGHWRLGKTNDFVTLGPNFECQFQLDAYAFKGKATYKRSEVGFIMEFPHQNQPYLFVLIKNRIPTGLGITNLAYVSLPAPSDSTDKASFCIGPSYVHPSHRRIDFLATLTKQTPSAAAP